MRRIIYPLLSLLLVPMSLVGCGGGFDPPSEVRSLRALAVRKDKPYAQPGETVNLTLLWHDGSVEPLEPGPPRDVQVQWITGCTNPTDNAYFGCFEQLLDPNIQVLDGETASFTVAPDVLSSRPPPRPGERVFGTSVVFFTLCAGTVSIEPSNDAEELPLVCRSADGERMGPDSFVVGYSFVYTFAGGEDAAPLTNANPEVQGFQIENESVESFCLNAECLTATPAPIDCLQTPRLCFSACEADGDAQDCPEIDVRPIVDPSSAEVDVGSGRNYTEQMWINYFVDRGSVTGDGVRLLNDATTGWNEDYGTEFFAPKEPGPVNLWAVVHDDRVGTSWVRTRIQIEPREDSE